MTSPATALVHLALKRWTQRRIHADNTSVIVVVFDSHLETARHRQQCSTAIHDRLPSQFVKDDEIVGNGAWDQGQCGMIFACNDLERSLNRIENRKFNHGFGRFRGHVLKLKNSIRKRTKHVRASFQIPSTPEERRAYWVRRHGLSFAGDQVAKIAPAIDGVTTGGALQELPLNWINQTGVPSPRKEIARRANACNAIPKLDLKFPKMHHVSKKNFSCHHVSVAQNWSKEAARQSVFL